MSRRDSDNADPVELVLLAAGLILAVTAAFTAWWWLCIPGLALIAAATAMQRSRLRAARKRRPL